MWLNSFYKTNLKEWTETQKDEQICQQKRLDYNKLQAAPFSQIGKGVL